MKIYVPELNRELEEEEASIFYELLNEIREEQRKAKKKEWLTKLLRETDEFTERLRKSHGDGLNALKARYGVV
ncbi:MAG: hypothetical protein QW186_08695 [Candidatus Bathyarchaeia archaeon]